MRKLSVICLCGVLAALTGCAYPDYYYNDGYSNDNYSYEYTEPAPVINVYNSYQQPKPKPEKVKHHSYKPSKQEPKVNKPDLPKTSKSKTVNTTNKANTYSSKTPSKPNSPSVSKPNTPKPNTPVLSGSRDDNCVRLCGSGYFYDRPGAKNGGAELVCTKYPLSCKYDCTTGWSFRYLVAGTNYTCQEAQQDPSFSRSR